MTKENIQRTERQGIIEFYLKRGRIVGAEGIEWDDNFSDRRRVGGGGGGGGLPRLGNNRRTLHKPNGSVGSCSVDGDVVFVTAVVLHRWDFRFSTKVVFLTTVWGFVRKRKTTGNDWNGPGLLFRVGSGRVDEFGGLGSAFKLAQRLWDYELHSIGYRCWICWTKIILQLGPFIIFLLEHL